MKLKWGNEPGPQIIPVAKDPEVIESGTGTADRPEDPEVQKGEVGVGGASDSPEDNVEKSLSETAKRTEFRRRLLANEGLFLNQKDQHPLRDELGAFLGRGTATKFFRELLKDDLGIAVASVRNHLVQYFLDPYFDEIKEGVSTAKEVKDRAEKRALQTDIKAAQDTLVERMREIITNPSVYGIDERLLDTKQWPNSRLNLFTIPEGEYAGLPEHLDANKNYQEGSLDHFEANLLNDEQVPDPFHVSGRLPDPDAIKDACNRLYEKTFPIDPEDLNAQAYRLGKQQIFERVIRQVTNELREAKRLHTGKKWDRRQVEERNVALKTALDRLTEVMRDIIVRGKADQYIHTISTGEINSDLVDIPHLRLRPRFGVSSGAEYRAFYENLTGNYSPEKLAELESQFDSGKGFFRDEAGVKDDIHAYADMVAVLKHIGLSEEIIRRSYAPALMQVITKLRAQEEQIQAEIAKGMKRSDKRLQELRNGRGQVRQEALGSAQRFLKLRATLENMAVSGDLPPDPMDHLAAIDRTEIESETPQFACPDLTDQDTRVETATYYLAQLQEAHDAALGDLKGKDNELQTFDPYFNAFSALETAKKTFEGLMKGNADVELETAQQVFTAMTAAFKDLNDAITAFREQDVDLSE